MSPFRPRGKSYPEGSPLAQAQAALRVGNFAEGVRILDADSASAEIDWMLSSWTVLSGHLASNRDPEMAAAGVVLSKAAKEPSNPAAISEAAGVLRRCRGIKMEVRAYEHLISLLPGESDPVIALAGVHESNADYPAASSAISKFLPDYRDLLAPTYFHAFSSIMSGDLAAAREDEIVLRRLYREQPVSDDLGIGRIEQMLKRAESIEHVSDLDEWDLRGWHYVITGGLLLHLAPEGWESMRGRWGFVQDDYPRCRKALERLDRVLNMWHLADLPVLSVDDSASIALAWAAQRLFGKELRPFDTSLEGIVIVYDLKYLDESVFQDLVAHRPDQVLYVHTSCWTNSNVYAADVVGHLHQSNVPPWGSRMRVTKDRKVEKTQPHPGPPEVWADLILADEELPNSRFPIEEVFGTEREVITIPDTFPTPDDVIDSPESLWHLARAIEGAAAAFATEGSRHRFWEGGPVPSAKFFT